MKLRLKVLVILALLWSIIALLITFYSKYMLSEDYVLLEQKQVIQNTRTVKVAIERGLASLRDKNADWAQWDNTCQFMKTKDEDYIKANFTPTAFKNIRLNVMLFYKPNGELYYSLNYNPTENAFVPAPKSLLDYLQTHQSILFQSANSPGIATIIKLDDAYFGLSAMPIINSQGKGPSFGTLVIGHFLTDTSFSKLSSLTQSKIEFFPLPLVNGDAALATTLSALQNGKTTLITPLGKDQVRSETLVNNLNNEPIGLLRITSHRDLYQQAMETITRYIVIIVSIGLLSLIAVWFLLKVLVLDRVIEVGDEINRIKATGQFNKRLSTNSDDEISQMATAMNELLEIIDLTKMQLEYKLTLQVDELNRLATLNKNLFHQVNQKNLTESKLKESEQILKQLAYYDPLTNLPNRLFFKEIAQKLLLKANRDGTTVAILKLDADGFKKMHGLYGETIGDVYIKESAARLGKLIQTSDVVARVAGDEFLVCLSNIRGKSTLKPIIERLLQRLSEPHFSDGLNLSSSFSIGVSLFPEDGDDIASLEQKANLAMHHAQREPGNSHCFFDEIKGSDE